MLHHGDYLNTPAAHRVLADLSANQLQYARVEGYLLIAAIVALAIYAFFEEFTISKRRT